MTQHIKQINILDMMKIYGEDSCKAVLSTFMCPLNLDVEDFIQNKAIEFARQRIAITFLVFKENENGSALVETAGISTSNLLFVPDVPVVPCL